MKVLHDEMLPAGVADVLLSDVVTTVTAAGFTGLENGESIRRAPAAGWDVLITADRNMPAQQNIPASGVALVLVPGNRMADISPRAAEIQVAVRAAKPGTVTRLQRPG